MPTFLSDPSPTLLMLLLVATVVAVGLWLRNRKRANAIVAAVFGLLLLLLILCDQFVKSPREEAERRVFDMVAACNELNPDRFMANVSESFDYKGAKKARLRTSGVWSDLRRYSVRVAAWDFSRDDVKEVSETEIEIGFLAKGEAEGKPLPKYVRTRFVRDPDGAYRLKGVAFYDALKRNSGPEDTIPNFP